MNNMQTLRLNAIDKLATFCDDNHINYSEFLKFIKNNTDGWILVLQYNELIEMLWKEYLSEYIKESLP